AYIAKQLTEGKLIEDNELRGIIIICAAARYAAFSLRISKPQSLLWNHAAEVVKYFPSYSPQYAKSLRIIIKQFKKFKKI
ncbi:Hypothetical protein FKW44_011393, partial [Caligus rogercresseyi]